MGVIDYLTRSRSKRRYYIHEHNNRQFVKVGRFFQSLKTCSECGWVKPKLNLSQRVFKCTECGASLDRDFNASRNILTEGLQLLGTTHLLGPPGVNACGEDVRHTCGFTANALYSKKQEPIIVPA